MTIYEEVVRSTEVTLNTPGPDGHVLLRNGLPLRGAYELWLNEGPNRNPSHIAAPFADLHPYCSMQAYGDTLKSASISDEIPQNLQAIDTISLMPGYPGGVIVRAYFVALSVAVCASASAQFNPIIQSGAYADYWSEFGHSATRQELSFPVNQLPGHVEVEQHRNHGGFQSYGRADRQTGYLGSNAWSAIDHPGLDKTFAYMGSESTPQNPDTRIVTAFGDALIKANYIASGPANTNVAVDLNYFLDGWLFGGSTVPNVKGGSGCDARVSIRMGILFEGTGGGSDIFSAGAVVVGGIDSQIGFSTEFWAANGWSGDHWSGSWSDTTGTLTHLVGTDVMYDLAYGEIIEDIVLVPTNTRFSLLYGIYSGAEIISVPNRPDGKFFAAANFANSGRSFLTCDTPGVDLQEIDLLVPEPSSALLFALGGGSLLIRRRK